MVIISSVIIAGSTPCICCVYGPLGQPSASYATSALDVASADVVAAATAVVGSVAWAFFSGVLLLWIRINDSLIPPVGNVRFDTVNACI